MHKFEVTWLLADGKDRKEYYEAEAYHVDPNTGMAMFLVFPKVTNVQFTPDPQGGQQRPAELVGTVGGYAIIKRL